MIGGRERRSGRGWPRLLFHIGETLGTRIVDLLRAARLRELPSVLRAHRDFAARSAAPTVSYMQALVDAMLALAQGEFDAASDCTAQAGLHCRDWGSSMANEALAEMRRVYQKAEELKMKSLAKQAAAADHHAE